MQQKFCSEASKQLQLRSLGGERHRIWGQTYNAAVLAPDTGSDVMVVNSAFAQSQDVQIVEVLETPTELTLRTLRQSTTSNSDVLNDLRLDTVRSKDLVFDFDLFSRLEDEFC